uniref:Uncharacterized protein n=1 Tax=Schistocephalus solidus TaxID=70667 RepID=A0A0V0JA37_SCHSO
MVFGFIARTGEGDRDHRRSMVCGNILIVSILDFGEFCLLAFPSLSFLLSMIVIALVYLHQADSMEKHVHNNLQDCYSTQIHGFLALVNHDQFLDFKLHMDLFDKFVGPNQKQNLRYGMPCIQQGRVSGDRAHCCGTKSLSCTLGQGYHVQQGHENQGLIKSQ